MNLKNRNKGFTLIELMAVIIILAVIGLVIFPSAIESVNNSKEKLYKEQVKRIIDATDSWAAGHDSELPEDEFGVKELSIEDLQTAGLLKNEVVKNPLNNKEKMDGKIVIYFDKSHNQYVSLYCDLEYGYKYYDDDTYSDMEKRCTY